MGSTRALPGRCGWPLANGGRCTKKPRQGFERCALHKGVEDRERQTKADRTPGSYLKGLAGRGAARLAEMMDDPELLNVRRPAALHAMSLDHVPFDPTPQLLEELARSNAARRLGVNLADLDPAAVAEVDRFEARVRTHKIASRAAADHAEVINQAKRAAGAEEVARAEALPLIVDLAKQLAAIARRYIPADRHEAFAADVAAAVSGSIARLGRVKHELVRQAEELG